MKIPRMTPKRYYSRHERRPPPERGDRVLSTVIIAMLVIVSGLVESRAPQFEDEPVQLAVNEWERLDLCEDEDGVKLRDCKRHGLNRVPTAPPQQPDTEWLRDRYKELILGPGYRGGLR